MPEATGRFFSSVMRTGDGLPACFRKVSRAAFTRLVPPAGTASA
jgi:hypothetical protein